jgi:AcrR family transcriptional regulator
MRKRVFTQQDVIDAGLAVVRRDGLDQLSARRVAEGLGASTRPVYSNFPTMEALADAVKQAAVRELLASTRVKRTGNAFLDLGLGVLTFVWDWPQLYAALFLAPATGYDPGMDLLEELTRATAEIPELKPLSPFERAVVLKKAAIFTHGLATEICQGCRERCSLDVLALMLAEFGRAVVEDARAGHARTPEQEQLLAELWADDTTHPRPGNVTP